MNGFQIATETSTLMHLVNGFWIATETSTLMHRHGNVGPGVVGKVVQLTNDRSIIPRLSPWKSICIGVQDAIHRCVLAFAELSNPTSCITCSMRPGWVKVIVFDRRSLVTWTPKYADTSPLFCKM